MTLDDVASDTEELFRQQALQHRKPELPKIGRCYECGETVNDKSCFCDKDCRETFERRQLNNRGK